jgi:hypothetical protein
VFGQHPCVLLPRLAAGSSRVADDVGEDDGQVLGPHRNLPLCRVAGGLIHLGRGLEVTKGGHGRARSEPGGVSTLSEPARTNTVGGGTTRTGVSTS